MKQWTTGLADILILFSAMALGAVFVFFAFQLGNAARPGEMKVWGSSEGTAPAASSSPNASVVATVPPGSATTPGGTADGKAVFEKNCSGCHPGAKKGVGPAISGPDFQQRYPQDASVVDIVRKGRNAMPSFKSDRLSDDELKAVVAYLRSVP